MLGAGRLGARRLNAHLVRPEVNLATHVHDIARLLDMEELEDANPGRAQL